MAKKHRETPHLRVRIEPSLLDKLEKAREKNGRTLTGEIVERLEESFRRQERTDLVTATAQATASATTSTFFSSTQMLRELAKAVHEISNPDNPTEEEPK